MEVFDRLAAIALTVRLLRSSGPPDAAGSASRQRPSASEKARRERAIKDKVRQLRDEHREVIE
jgi:hypothetical protein